MRTHSGLYGLALFALLAGAVAGATPLVLSGQEGATPKPLTLLPASTDLNAGQLSGALPAPVITYERTHAPVLEGLATGFAGRSTPLRGSQWIATASGYLNVGAISEAPEHYASMLETPISPDDVAVVHFGDMPMERVRGILQAANLTPLGQVPNNAMVVTGVDASAVEYLNRVHVSLLAWTPGFFVPPDLGRTPVYSAAAAAETTLSMKISVFPGTDTSVVAARLEALGGTILHTINGVISFSIDIDDLRAGLGTLTGLPIRAFAETARFHSQDEDTNSGVQVGKFRSGDRPYTEAGIDGTDQIIGITDTGLSLDSAVFAHDESTPGTPGPTHRKIQAYVTADAFGGAGDLLTCDGVNGATHGHLVASIAAAGASEIIPDIRVMDAFDTAREGTFTAEAVDGLAAGARVYFIDDQVLSGCTDPAQIQTQHPGILSANAQASQGGGARIHNFSFAAAGSEASYTLDAQDLDTFLEANTSFLVVVAAGNGGIDRNTDGNLDFGTVTSPATAKNVLTVGSSGYPNNELDISQSVVANVENNGIGVISRWNRAANGSGQGPAAFTENRDGGANWRIKPDLMAPGDESLGNQRLVSPTTCASQDNDQTGEVECSRLATGIFAGTSFASAATAGAAALVRDYFAEGFAPAGVAGGPSVDISGIELKAALIASADLMTGNPAWFFLSGLSQLEYYTPKHLSTFTPEQGYGRIQLNKLLPLGSEPGSPSYIHTEVLSVPLAGSVSRIFTVVNPDEEARCVVSWYDEEATLTGPDATGELVHNIDLTVHECGATCGDADDVRYNGNYFSEDTDFNRKILQLETQFHCSNIPGAYCDPEWFEPEFYCGDPLAQCVVNTPAMTEDCNFNGSLDFSEFSLPVFEGSPPIDPETGLPRYNCPGQSVDINNNNEAVFLSPSQIGQGDLLQVNVAWSESSAGSPPTNLDVALVCTGALATAGTPDSVRLNKGRYTCGDILDVTAIAPAGSSTGDVRQAVTVSSFDAAGLPLDSEYGLTFNSADLVVFSSRPMAVVDAATNPPAANDLILAVESGGSIVTTYGNAEASASVRCTPQLQISNIVRRGMNASYGISGGCDPLGRIDPRTIIQSAIPGTGTLVTGDLFLDANEDLVYSMGFTNQEEGDPLQDVKATLKACVAGSIQDDGSCTAADGITIHDPVQSLGAISSGKSQKASFNLHVSAAAMFPVDQVQLVFGISAARNGLTLDSTAVIAHVLNQDRWSFPNEDPAISGAHQYSTDYPRGGREIRVYAGEFFNPANPALAAEEFLFSDMTDASYGGGNTTILGFNSASGRFDTPVPNNMPWTFDLDDEQFGARRRFDSDPGDNLELAARNTWQWNNTGECGFQSNDASQDDWDINSFCSNIGTTSCDPQNYDPLTDCGDPLATCEPANRGSGGMWHTGHAESMAGTPDGRTGYDLGCENYDLPGSPDPKREQVIDSVSSPIFFRVHQAPDSNGFAYQVEFTRLGFNLQHDLGDENAIVGYEIDPDTSTAQPVDPLDLGWLASDQGTTGFLSGVSQQTYQAFNPNDPQEGTSITVTPGGMLDASGSETNNILAIHGPGSAGPFYEVGNSNKAPARQFGELHGLLTGRGMTSATRRGAAGFPVRNYDNDLRESFQLTFEDIYGANESRDPGQTYPITAGNPEGLTNQRNSFQTNFTMILRETRSYRWDPPVPSYGVGFDDVVVEWRESHPVQDRTPCSDPSTWAMDYDTQQPVGSSTTCVDGPLAGIPCSSDSDCGSGICSSRRAAGCAQISWDRQSVTSPEDTLTVTVIDSNAQFGPDGIAGTGDEQAMDSNDDGFVELIVPVSSDADLVGEQLVLTQIALVSPVYKGTVAVSTTKGLSSGEDGTLFIQQNGDGNNPTAINAFYNDQDINVAGAGFPAVPCPDNPLVATALTHFVGADIAFVTATIRDVGPNADGDLIADPGETIEMDLTMISNVLGVKGASAGEEPWWVEPAKPVIEDVTITLLASSLQVGPDNPIACILNGETFMGDLDPGFPRTTDPLNPLRWVVGDVQRYSLSQVLQARFRLGISGHYTDNRGIRNQVTSFSTPQEFGINLDLDILPGGGQAVSTSFACVGGSLSGRPCLADADCPGQRFDLEGGGPRAATCDPLPDYLSAGGNSLLAGKVGYFESFEGADNMAGRRPDWGPAAMPGTSFEQLPALFPVEGGYLERFVRDTLGRGVLEGLSPGSTPGGEPDIPEGSSAVDGSRCQFNDPQGPAKWPTSEFFCRPWAGSDWHVNDNKAFTGSKSLYAGVNGIEEYGYDISWDTTHTNALYAAFSDNLHVGVAGGASLSMAHIVATADDRTFSVPRGNAAGRTYLEWTEVDPSSGTPVSAWRKVNGFQNNYSSTGVIAFFSNCVFSSYDEFYDATAVLGGTPGFNINATNSVGVPYNDDGLATEDDYFDPNDPNRLYGPSNGCYPQFVFSSLGNYSSSDLDAYIGRSFTGGELGETGTGVWVKSIFSLDEAAGKTIRIRLVQTDIDIFPGITWNDIFSNSLGDAIRGWRVDDFAASGLVDAPTVLAIDGRFPDGLPPGDCPVDPDPGTPGNPAACNQVTAVAGDDLLTPVSGSQVALDASASSFDACVNGHMEYQWDVGGGVIQEFSTNPVLLDAPRLTTTYNVTARCSTDNGCRDTDQVLVMPGDQLEASGDLPTLLDVNLPVGSSAVVEADEPAVGGPCDLYLMNVPVATASGPDLREKATSGSVADLAGILRADTCTDGMMLQDAGTLRFTFDSTIPVNTGDVQGYMANALCDQIIGSLGLVKKGNLGIRGSRGRLNPNAAPPCEP